MRMESFLSPASASCTSLVTSTSTGLPSTTVQLARTVGFSVQEMQRRLALLERAGYIARPANALIPAFALTPLGREVAESQ